MEFHVRLGSTTADDGNATLGAVDMERLRELARRHEDTPMLELDFERKRPLPLRLRCGAPMRAVDADMITREERSRLKALRSACPAFFAPRGRRRRRLDWLHRRRTLPITDDSIDAACAMLSWNEVFDP